MNGEEKKTKRNKRKKMKENMTVMFQTRKKTKQNKGNKSDRFCLHMHIERNNTVALNNSRYQIRVRLISPATNILVLNEKRRERASLKQRTAWEIMSGVKRMIYWPGAAWSHSHTASSTASFSVWPSMLIKS